MRWWEVIFIFLAATSPAFLFGALGPLLYIVGTLAASITCEVLEGRRRYRAEARWRSVADVFS